MINLRGMFSKKVLLAMFYDLKHDAELAKSSQITLLEINTLRKAVLEALEGDFSLYFDEETENFTRIQ